MKEIDTGRIEFLGLDRVLKRGTGEILCRQETALLVRDSVSGAVLLACDDASAGLSVLERHLDGSCRLLMVSDLSLGRTAFERYGFSEALTCFQAAYYGDPPAPDPRLSVRTAGPDDLPLLLSCYDLISPEELEQVVVRRSVLLGCVSGQPVGFIGGHLEGSMGLLYIFPEFRRRGYGAALENRLIAKTLKAGFVPFGQVEAGNAGSLRLQKRLGMTLSDKPILWMWK